MICQGAPVISPNPPLGKGGDGESIIELVVARAIRNHPEQAAEGKRRYRQANKEKLAEGKRRYYEANKEKVAETQRRYRQANKEKLAEGKRRYYEANKEKLAETQRRYYEANKEKLAEWQRRYRQANKLKAAGEAVFSRRSERRACPRYLECLTTAAMQNLRVVPCATCTDYRP